jgi:hypothetical protein
MCRAEASPDFHSTRDLIFVMIRTSKLANYFLMIIAKVPHYRKKYNHFFVLENAFVTQYLSSLILPGLNFLQIRYETGETRVKAIRTNWQCQ